jgi:hypothetical protein
MATKKSSSQKSRGKKNAKTTGSRRSSAKSKSANEAKASAKSSESDAEGRADSTSSRSGGTHRKKRRSRSVKTVPLRPKIPRKFVRSGDLQGLPVFADASTESVSELVDEGQFIEAGFVSGVEEAPAADLSEVRTREVPEDDVPPEYDDPDTIV